jgi:aryl-alcohol dehydrogenase-like predicted oxidoreductase
LASTQLCKRPFSGLQEYSGTAREIIAGEGKVGDFWNPVKLGNTDLRVVPIGLAASYGISGSGLERAFERGVNFLYWGAKYAPILPRSGDFGAVLRRLGSSHRDKIVTVIQSYARSPEKMTRSIENGLRQIGFDFTDVLLLGWWNLAPPEPFMDAATELVRRGRARYVMISCHHRPTFPVLARDPRVQLMMIRYNAAHPGAERDVFPQLGPQRPGIVAYTSTSWGELLNPKLTPADEDVPTASDCYRFVLSSRFVDACWAGAKNMEELEAALKALDRGPMGEEELAWMRRVGGTVRQRTRKQDAGRGFADRVVNWMSGFGFRSSSQLARGTSGVDTT